MKLRTALIVLGVLFGLTVSASSAEAAKGVKKKKGNGEHHHHGKVISVDHKAGHFTIAAHHHSKKKKGAAAGANKGATQVHHIKFNVTNGSKFSVSQNKNKTPSTFSALHVGEHVSVASKNQHADSVVIHKHTKAKKKNPKPKKLK